MNKQDARTKPLNAEQKCMLVGAVAAVKYIAPGRTAKSYRAIGALALKEANFLDKQANPTPTRKGLEP